MARLPIVGGDNGNWGTILNDFLAVSLNSEGTIQPAALTEAGAVTSVNGLTPPTNTGNVTLTAASVGALAATASAGGDLSGSYPNPTVASLNGISVSGSPSNGQVLTASGGSSANWSNITGTLDWINVVTEYGADPTGTSDSTTAILNAVAALNGGGGVVYIPVGTYKVSSTITLAVSQYLFLDGPSCVIDFTGTGDAVRQYHTDSSDYVTANGGGVVGQGTIDGTNAGAGSAGLHVGDIFQLHLDVEVRNFTATGSIGVHFDNQYWWCEQMRARLFVHSCTSGVVFDVSGNDTSTGSYARAIIDIFLDQTVIPGYNGVVFQNGAVLYDGHLGIYGNFAGSSSALSNSVLTLTGSIPAGHTGSYSYITACDIRIGVEVPTGHAYTPTTITFGANNHLNVSTGMIDFGEVGAFASCTTNDGNFNFQGRIRGDSALTSSQDYGQAPEKAVTANGQALGDGTSAVLPVNPGSTSYTGMVLTKGYFSGQLLHVQNLGSGSVTFAAPGTSYVADGTSDVIEGLSGATYLWDANTSLWYRMGSSGVSSISAGDSSIVIGGTASTPTVETGTLDVIAADHPPAADWSNNDYKITSLANGVASTDAAAFGQTPAGGNTVTIAEGGTGATTASSALTNLGALQKVADTGISGFALQDGTPTILSGWTAPDDGAMHIVCVTAYLHVTSAETGGLVQGNYTTPDNVAYTPHVFVISEAAGFYTFTGNYLVAPNTTFSLSQGTALTAGAATVWAQLWAA